MVMTLAHTKNIFTRPTIIKHIVNITKWFMGHQLDFTTIPNNGTFCDQI
jgi:hypothetical protein